MTWNLIGRSSVRILTVAMLAMIVAACGDTGSSDHATSTSDSTGSTSKDSLELSSASYSVAQGSGSVTLIVNRTGPTSSTASVAYVTADGTAVAGTDYTGTSGLLQWAENDSTPKTITVAISDVTPFSGTKSFQVMLSNPSSAAVIGTPDSATVVISGDAVAAIGDVQLSSASYAVGQGAGTATVTVNRVGGASGAVGVAYATASGTAMAGTDFTATSGTLDWADGDASSKSFTVPVSNAAPFSGSKAFSVILSGPSGGVLLGDPASATVTITGDATAATGTLQLGAPSYNVNQQAGNLTVTVQRMSGSNGAASVAYATANGTAISGTNFTAASGTLSWASGDTAPKSFSVAISNATPFSGNKTFNVGLSSPSTGATISNPGSATVTIAGDAQAPVGSLELSAASYSVQQSAGTVTVTVDRVGGSSGAVSVFYQSHTGTAVVGTDYTGVNGTLQWASGDSSAKSFTVAISNATPFSGNKSFTVSLSNASGGATLGSPTSASVVIAGDAAAAVGSFQLSSSSYTVAQSTGSLTVTVNRTGGSSGAVSVGYATANGTAIAGTNFTAASGTLDWASGDASSKTFTVAINESAALSGNGTFTVALSGPSGGATLSTPSSATVTIEGTTAPPQQTGTAPTNVQVIRQGQSLNTSTNNYSCSIVSKGGTSLFEPNYNYIGFHSVAGATSYNIYRATNGGAYSKYDSVTAAAASANYSTYLTGLTNQGNTYYTAPGIDSAYFDTKATGIVGQNSGSDFTAIANVSSGSTSIEITGISNGTVAVGQGIGDTNGNIPVGTTLVAGPGGTGTYTMSQAATGNATGETVGAVVSGDQGYTYYMTAVIGGVESAPSAYAILPFIVNGGFLMSNGAFNSCLVANLAAPATTPLGWSKAAGLWTTEPASGAPSVQAPLPNCSGYPQYMNAYSGWGAASYNLSLGGYKYLNIAVWTSTSGAQLAQGAPEICGDAPLTPITHEQIAAYGPDYLTPNAWTTYKIPVSVAYSDINSHVTQSALYKITWGFGGTPSNTTPIYIEYWFSVN